MTADLSSIGPDAEHLRGLVQVAVLLEQVGQVYDGVVVVGVGPGAEHLHGLV